MNGRSALVAAALVAILGSWYYFYEFKGKQKRDLAKDESKIVFKGFEPSAVDSLLLRKPGADIDLKKQGGDWMITSPLQAEADQAVVTTALEAFKGMKREEMVDEAGTDPGAYGLESPTSWAAYAGLSGSGKVLFGRDNPTGQFSYAMVEGQKPIFLIMRYGRSNILKELKDLRNKAVWSFQPSEVTALRSSFAGGLGLSKDKDGQWSLTKPFADKAQGDAVTAWLNQLQGLRIEAFTDEEGKNPARFGITPSSPRIEISLAGRPQPLVLTAGPVQGKDKVRHYRLQGKPLIFSMAQYAQSLLEKKPGDLADRDAFSLKTFEVERFEIERGGKTLRAAKKDGAWSFNPPLAKKEGEPDFDVYGFLSGLSQAKLKARLPKGTAVAGSIISFYDAKGSVIEKISLGEKGKAFSQAKNAAVIVDEALLKSLPQ